MPVEANSRYANNKIVAVEDRKGKVRPTLVIEPPGEKRISFSTYVWQDGDQIEYLAYSAYGDEVAWWIIADANPEIMFWNDLPRGTEVRVPSV